MERIPRERGVTLVIVTNQCSMSLLMLLLFCSIIQVFLCNILFIFLSFLVQLLHKLSIQANDGKQKLLKVGLPTFIKLFRQISFHFDFITLMTIQGQLSFAS